LIDRIEDRRERLAERSVARLDAIAEGLGRALEASRAARRDAAGELEERRRSLDQRRARLDAIQTDLDAIRREVERL
jgi:chromosome segregation ATPase